MSGDLVLGTIDETTEPIQPSVAIAFTAANLEPDELQFLESMLETSTTQAWLSRGIDPQVTWNGAFVPAALLRPTDHQFALMSAVRELASPGDGIVRNSERDVWREVRFGDSTEVTLPAPLDAVALDSTDQQLTATWSSLPDYDTVLVWRFGLSNDGANSRSQQLLLTRNVVAAVGATTATLDFSDLPMFDPTWAFDPADFQTRGISVTHTVPADTEMTSSVYEDVALATPPDPSALARLAQRAHRIDSRHPQADVRRTIRQMLRSAPRGR